MKGIRYPLLLVCLAGLTWVSGCSSGAGGRADPEQEIRINDDPEETRIWKVNNPYVTEYNYLLYLLQDPEGPYFDERDTTETVFPPEYAGPYFHDETYWDNLIFMYSRSELGGDTPPGFASCTLMLSFVDKKTIDSCYGLYYGKARSARGREIQEGLDNLFEVGFEMAFHGYFVPERYPKGWYWIIGARLGALIWYSSGDRKGTFSGVPYIGVGASLWQSGKFTFGFSSTIGMRGTGQENEGEVFTPIVGEVKVNFVINYLLD